MARMTLTLPDRLAEQVATMPGLNVSGVLQEALWALVDCRHAALVCRCCAQPVDLGEVRAQALAGFYRDVAERLEQAVARQLTAEGAARAVREVAVAHRCAGRGPTPPAHPGGTASQQREEMVA